MNSAGISANAWCPQGSGTNSASASETPGNGHGSFAIKPIAAGTLVACFGGTPLPLAEFSTHLEERRSRSIQIEHDTFVLGPPAREPGDSINHSCEPNLGLVSATRLVEHAAERVSDEGRFRSTEDSRVELQDALRNGDELARVGLLTEKFREAGGQAVGEEFEI